MSSTFLASTPSKLDRSTSAGCVVSSASKLLLPVCLIIICLLCLGVFMERLCCTWWTAAHQPPTLLVISICGPPVSGSWSFRVIVWAVPVVSVLLSRASRPGIHYLTLTVFATQHWVSVFLGISWRHTFWEMLTRCTQHVRDLLIMCYINLHFTNLLTHKRPFRATSKWPPDLEPSHLIWVTSPSLAC